MLVLSVLILTMSGVLLGPLVYLTYLRVASGQPVTRLGYAYRAEMQRTRLRVAAPPHHPMITPQEKS